MNEQKTSNFYIITIAFFAAIAGLLFGFDTGVISGALQFISHTFGITKQHYQIQEFIVAAVPFGTLIGAILSKKSSFWLGRRRSIITTAVMFVIGTLSGCVQNKPIKLALQIQALSAYSYWYWHWQRH